MTGVRGDRPHPAGGDARLRPLSSTPIGELPPTLRQAIESAKALVAKAKRILPDANAEDAEELRAMLTDLQAAVDRRAEDDIRNITAEVEDLVFYLEDV